MGNESAITRRILGSAPQMFYNRRFCTEGLRHLDHAGPEAGNSTCHPAPQSRAVRDADEVMEATVTVGAVFSPAQRLRASLLYWPRARGESRKVSRCQSYGSRSSQWAKVTAPAFQRSLCAGVGVWQRSYGCWRGWTGCLARRTRRALRRGSVSNSFERWATRRDDGIKFMRICGVRCEVADLMEGRVGLIREDFVTNLWHMKTCRQYISTPYKDWIRIVHQLKEMPKEALFTRQCGAAAWPRCACHSVGYLPPCKYKELQRLQ